MDKKYLFLILGIFLLIGSLGFGSSALADNLTSYYKLDESSGNLKDAYGSSNLTYNGALYSQTGKINTSIGFDGINDYGSGGPQFDITTDDFSVSLWAYFDDVSEGTLWSNRNTASDKAVITMGISGSGVLKFIHRNDASGITLVTVGSVSTGSWYHAVVTYDAATKEMIGYLNNVSGTPGPGPGGTTSINVASIGNTQPYNQFFEGELDEIAIFSKVLTPTEIIELYNLGTGLSYPFYNTPAISNLNWITTGGFTDDTLLYNQVLDYVNVTSSSADNMNVYLTVIDPDSINVLTTVNVQIILQQNILIQMI